MIINKVEIQARLREGTLLPRNVLRLDAETLVGIEEADFIVLENIVHRGQEVRWYRAVSAEMLRVEVPR